MRSMSVRLRQSRVGIGRVVPATALTGEWQAKLSSAPTAAFLFGDFCNKICQLRTCRAAYVRGTYLPQLDLQAASTPSSGR
jgi:hypothetical protein